MENKRQVRVNIDATFRIRSLSNHDGRREVFVYKILFKNRTGGEELLCTLYLVNVKIKLKIVTLILYMHCLVTMLSSSQRLSVNSPMFCR